MIACCLSLNCSYDNLTSPLCAVTLAEHPEGGQQVVTTLERVKHYLWHGNVDKALECLGLMLFDLDVHRRRFPSALKLERSVTEFETYIRNNQKFTLILGNAIAKATPLARPLWNRRLIKW
jgi:hypothetical protein